MITRENEGIQRDTPGLGFKLTLKIMLIPLKLLIDGLWTEISFLICPHDSQPGSDVLSERKIMADSRAMEIQFVDKRVGPGKNPKCGQIAT